MGRLVLAVMEFTKKGYITLRPNSALGRALALNDWPDNTVIEVVESVIQPHNKKCNLGWYMHLSEIRDFVVGRQVGRMSDDRYLVAVAIRVKQP